MTTQQNVPLLDPTRANSPIESELREAFERVLQSGKFILGAEVEAFEKACADYLRVKHAIGVSSGTDALIVSLMALGIGKGDEVICPSFTFFASAGAIWRTGATPVFVDIHPCCFNLDPEDVARKISSPTKAIMPVHLFGQSAEMDAINTLAEKNGLAVIEDAAQAIGAEFNGRPVGALGTLGCFSFFPSKNLGGFGDSGLVTTNDAKLADAVRSLRTHGGQKMYEHPVVGGNFRIDALQAALLRVKLAHVESYAAQRRKNAALYNDLFTDAGIGAVATEHAANGGDQTNAPGDTALLLPATCHKGHVYNQYVVRVRGKGRREALRKQLQSNGIGCAVYYPLPLHQQPCFASLNTEPLPVTEAAADEVLALPIFSELSEQEIRHVAAETMACVESWSE